MKKEKRNIKVQIRITSSEKILLSKLLELDKELSISRLFRESLHENCEKRGIKIHDGIGSFTVG